MRDLKIKPALNGYICLAGCQTLVFNDAKTMLYEIGRYLKDPSGVEKEYIKNAVNKMADLPMPDTACDAQMDAPRGVVRPHAEEAGRIARAIAGHQNHVADISVNGVRGFEACSPDELR